MSRSEPTKSTIKGRPLRRAKLGWLDAWWRAVDYLSMGQIYLIDNLLQRDRLLTEHVKPRLLGHGGTTPGLKVAYAQLNRAICRERTTPCTSVRRSLASTRPQPASATMKKMNSVPT